MDLRWARLARTATRALASLGERARWPAAVRRSRLIRTIRCWLLVVANMSNAPLRGVRDSAKVRPTRIIVRRRQALITRRITGRKVTSSRKHRSLQAPSGARRRRIVGVRSLFPQSARCRSPSAASRPRDRPRACDSLTVSGDRRRNRVPWPRRQEQVLRSAVQSRMPHFMAFDLLALDARSQRRQAHTGHSGGCVRPVVGREQTARPSTIAAA